MVVLGGGGLFFMSELPLKQAPVNLRIGPDLNVSTLNDNKSLLDFQENRATLVAKW